MARQADIGRAFLLVPPLALISSWTIAEFEKVGPNFRLKAQAALKDGSQLLTRQVILAETTFHMTRPGETVAHRDWTGVPAASRPWLSGMDRGAAKR